MNEQVRIEEVDGVDTPPRARVESAAETFERKRDYLEGFLAQQPEADAAAARGVRSRSR